MISASTVTVLKDKQVKAQGFNHCAFSKGGEFI